MGKIACVHHDKIGILVEQKGISPDTKYFYLAGTQKTTLVFCNLVYDLGIETENIIVVY
jgi:hypothetical protein